MVEIKDLKYLSELYVSVFSLPPWNEYWEYSWAEERLAWIFNSQGFMGYLATINDEIIGTILGNLVPFKGTKRFKILDFFVSYKYQKQGIGSQLICKLESELKTNSYNFVTLLTAKNSKAETFYLHKDYQINEKLELLYKEL